MITFHSFSFLPDWVFLNWEGEERESGREFLSFLKVLCEDGWVSVHYRKGPDHHWMTLLGVTKPNWSRPPAANGPERNSPGWVMTVFSAFLFTPFWCPRTPHLTPAATSPIPSLHPLRQLWAPPWPTLLVSSTLTHTSTQCCWSQCLSAWSTWQQMLQTDQEQGIRGPYVWMRHGPPAFPTQRSLSLWTQRVHLNQEGLKNVKGFKAVSDQQ